MASTSELWRSARTVPSSLETMRRLGYGQAFAGERTLTVNDSGSHVAAAGGDDAESDAGFGVAHGGELGAGCVPRGQSGNLRRVRRPACGG
jgi:hypothetical protein